MLTHGVCGMEINMLERKLHDGETKLKLLKCAKEEFMEKGFTGASLRSICRKADVTTGALYFFFKDKDDLFCQVVGNLMQRLDVIIKEHLLLEEEEMIHRKETQHDDSSDYESMEQIVHELYAYRDEALLVLTKSQGSGMEYMVDHIIDEMDEHNALICEAMCKANGTPAVDEKVIHWMSHSQVDMFVYMVIHIDDEEEALEFAEKGMKYLISGWYGLVKR